MKSLFRVPARLALGLLLLPVYGQAAEIPLNAIGETPEGVTTELTDRESGPYVGAWLGAVTGGRASFRNELRGAELGGSTGFTGGLKLGYSWQTPIFLRPSVEVEFAYLTDDLNPTGSVDGSGRNGGEIKTGGSHLNALVGTVNLVLALDLGAIRDRVGEFVAGLHPYIGIGVGGAYGNVQPFQAKVTTDGEDEKIRVEGGSKIDFAHQLLAGLEIDLDDELSIFGEYKRISLDSTGSKSIRDYERDLWVFGCKFAY
jgi:opacity protein-like surface antigen